jgi:tetratricopeptide (TPR) repeat protein
MVVVGAVLLAGAAEAKVQVWQEPITLPTYRLLPPDPNPMFYKGESYQGAQKRLYPYPLIDGITGIREDATYTAVYLENEYVRLCVLPEIGGRLFSAVDKTNGYDFFYRQHVIKPALIGMLGAWISGGVEWCVFHHHRNTTHMPVDYAVRENPDGSATVWIGETERRHRMRWTIALTLRPGASYLEAAVTMRNRTPHAHSILYWANVAVHVNDRYQVIFPPSVQVATYHSKNDFTYWPIGRGRYRGSDYTGVDLSWWKNHPKPVSCFAWGLREDFMGGYDHAADAGVVHVGNHHVVCGAKLWEWAPGNVWDTKILTDSDGPYAELMVGAFSDNQPDYSWIRPYEVKAFRQYWYPVRGIGGFKTANLHAALNLERRGGKAVLGIHATSPRKMARVTLTAGKTVLLDDAVDISPEKPLAREVALPADAAETALEAVLRDAAGRVLIAYRPSPPEPVNKLPEVVKPPPPPKEIETVEELYLTGLRIQQIHNPSIDPSDYYEEALRRDPGDARTNTIVGANLIRRGLYEKAEAHLRRAVERVSAEYTRPRNAEAWYLLGLAMKARGATDEADDALYRATWDAACHSAAYLELATLAARRGDFRTALQHVDHSLATNTRNARAVCLKAAVLRHLGEHARAAEAAAAIAAEDPLCFFALNELALAQADAGKKDKAAGTLETLTGRMRGDVQSYLELAADYMDAGLVYDAIAVLRRQAAPAAGRPAESPMLYYTLGYLYEQSRKPGLAREARTKAAGMPPDYCFPFRLEMIDVLEAALRASPDDARAWLYLGNLLYEIQPERAIVCWNRSREADPSEGQVHRNLGWATFRQDGDVPAAIAHYEKAVACAADFRYCLELDDLYERANTPPAKRLEMLAAIPRWWPGASPC